MPSGHCTLYSCKEAGSYVIPAEQGNYDASIHKREILVGEKLFIKDSNGETSVADPEEGPWGPLTPLLKLTL